MSALFFRAAARLQGGVSAVINRMHALPDFVIVGAAKAGTSSLYALLGQHPQICSASKKELHFFDNNFGRGEWWYRSQFPTRVRMMWQAHAGHPVITGEASPYYLFHPHAPRRLAEVVPEVKLIALLRDPVQRARSHHAHNVRKGEETLEFGDAIAQEHDRIFGERERMLANETYYSQSYRLYSYAARGVYIDQIKELHAHFSAEQVLVIKSEFFFAHPQAALHAVYDFLGVEHVLPGDLTPRNVGEYASSNEHLDAVLYDYFRKYNEALYGYLGVDYGWEHRT